MSLGYQKGKAWVTDDRYRRYTEWDTYTALVAACRAAGFSFNISYSYAARQYTAEIIETYKHANGQYSLVPREMAYHHHPLAALTAAIRRRQHNCLLLAVLCVEMDCRIIGEKLLPMKSLEKSFDDLISAMGSLT